MERSTALLEREEDPVVNGDGPYRSLHAPGRGAAEATGVVREALAALPGFSVHVVAPGRISVSRSRRPGWAVAACVATIWIAGVGLLFLLVRRTESGEVVVSDGPRGCVVTVPPLLDETAHRALAEALGPRAAAPPAFAAEVGDGDDLEARTVARREETVVAGGGAVALAPPPPPPPGPAPASVVLRFAAGTVRVTAGRPVVLGRDPSPPAGAEGQVAPGDASSVSKSHLLVAFDGHTVTVQDLGSTNGSSVVRSGSTEPLVPGIAAPVGHGDEVAMGVLAFAVDRSGAGAA